MNDQCPGTGLHAGDEIPASFVCSTIHRTMWICLSQAHTYSYQGRNYARRGSHNQPAFRCRQQHYMHRPLQN